MTIEPIERRVVYENAYATVWDDVVRFPDGHTGTYLRSRWKAPHGVAVVPLLGEEILLVRLFRYQEQRFSVEIPQGFGTAGSTPEQDARRELREETGLIAGAMEPLLWLGGDFVTHVFLTQLDRTSVPSVEGQETTESIGAVVRVPLADITPDYFRAVGIFDASTIAALLAVRSFTPR